MPVGSTVTFSVVATNADTYQWYCNNVAMNGQTNSSVTVPNVTTNSVGYYSAYVINQMGGVPTRQANLAVYTTSGSTSSSSTSTTSRLAMSSMTMSSTLTGGGDVTVYAYPVSSGGGSGTCPGQYAGYVSFTKTAAQGWGWAPSSGTNVHTATDNNQSNTKIQYMGEYGDMGCAQTTVSVPNPMSPVYRFTIYFPTNSTVPTNSYPITLSGFDP